ncbi:MAG: site-specific DNA-methyltransferase [Deltaproteobacteria bacterium HGW-Deltaproteobacteria-12]|jgi:adenine-specific DNA-methyltransferase|nr:MAG: site-specific DNA-methyltransferase [Deltaproteobacteria bacterium HGW-Deltaproteobacteria-12]
MVNGNTKKQKLELTWIGKENRPRLEPRILLEDPEQSYHAKHRVTGKDIFDNQLIFGDNLLALKALESEYAGKVKCIYIDPPYNTGSAFEHYDDGIEHSVWLSLMRDRMECLRRLLSNHGSLWVSIDDNECHYFRVMMDEIFGRQNFVASIIWQKLFTVKNSARHFSDMHDYILVFAKDACLWERNLLPRSVELDETYTNPDADPRGPWTTNAVQARNYYSQGTYGIQSPSGKVFKPPKGTYWRVSQTTFDELNSDGRIWWGKTSDSIPRIKKFLSEAKQGVVPATMWLHSDCGTNAEAKTELRSLLAGPEDTEMFITPKPERLIRRILEVATNPGDLILDSFAGSGTTGAVAHKMGRRWIMVELGEHCHTHIIPRLKKVIDGEDSGGITKAVNWKGGGGFRYYRLAPSLLEKDKWDNWIINKTYNAAMLAEALCKLEGFTYAPSDTVYWQQGFSTERDFLYVTTAGLTHEQLLQLADEVGLDRTLLVLCTAFRGRGDYPNLTVKKIPRQVLSRCEWGHDDYSLQVENLPQAPPKAGQQSLFTEEES